MLMSANCHLATDMVLVSMKSADIHANVIRGLAVKIAKKILSNAALIHVITTPHVSMASIVTLVHVLHISTELFATRMSMSVSILFVGCMVHVLIPTEITIACVYQVGLVVIAKITLVPALWTHVKITPLVMM